VQKIFIFILAIAPLLAARAQPAASPGEGSAPARDVAELREQVKTLTETVKALQQQVKEQQTALEKANLTGAPSLPQSSPAAPPEAAAAAVAGTPAPQNKGTPPPLIPTEDNSVVASAPGSSSKPAATGVDANGNTQPGSIPTTDSSVVASSSEVPVTSGGGSSLTNPITLISGGGGKNYMNVSFDSVMALAYSSDKHLDQLEVGDHDPQQRGYNLRNAELAFDGAVDPYFEGFANIVFLLDNDQSTEVELEEAFLQTTSLPYNLQLKAGQFFAAFGRLNPTHPHTWDFADTPLVIGRLLGPDGLRGVGSQISWTLPVPWYSQLFLGMQNGRGETGYSFRNTGNDGVFFERETIDHEIRGLYDFVWVPRWENSVDLSPTQTVLLGVSGAFGSNDTGDHTRTQIYGTDLLYKWKSANAEGGFPFVKWQTEFLYRRFEAGRGFEDTFPVAETFHDWGMYSQVLWGFHKGWVAGVRGDYLHMTDSHYTDDPERDTRSRISADLTWYPTEFSKIRLQYNHDFLEPTFFMAGKDADSVFLQIEFILGAHGAHKF
jgi:hypothetical protein